MVKVFLCYLCRSSPIRYRTVYDPEWRIISAAVLDHIKAHPEAVTMSICSGHAEEQLKAIEFHKRTQLFLSDVNPLEGDNMKGG